MLINKNHKRIIIKKDNETPCGQWTSCPCRRLL